MDKKNKVTADMLSPKKLSDALSLVKNGYKPVCGGSDLLIRRHTIKTAHSHNLGKRQEQGPAPVFYAGKIEELNFIEKNGDSLRIGSGATLSRIINSGDCPPVLAQALESIASPGIRNSATLTGNICNASPAGDSLPPLYIFDAVIETASLDDSGNIARRHIPITEFITGPGRTALAGDELVTAVSIPQHDGIISVFRKVGTRAANALSKLSIAALWKLDGEIITDFRLAVGACGPTVIRSLETEALIKGRTQAEAAEWIEEITGAYSAILRPIDDQRSTAEYRKSTALRLIENIISQIGGCL